MQSELARPAEDILLRWGAARSRKVSLSTIQVLTLEPPNTATFLARVLFTTGEACSYLETRGMFPSCADSEDAAQPLSHLVGMGIQTLQPPKDFLASSLYYTGSRREWESPQRATQGSITPFA